MPPSVREARRRLAAASKSTRYTEVTVSRFDLEVVLAYLADREEQFSRALAAAARASMQARQPVDAVSPQDTEQGKIST